MMSNGYRPEMALWQKSFDNRELLKYWPSSSKWASEFCSSQLVVTLNVIDGFSTVKASFDGCGG